MLIVLENYVLDAIGKLEPEKSAKLNEMIGRTFGGKDWRGTVREQFALGKETDENLRAMWKQKLEEGEANQRDVEAEDFAREAVDEMFSGLGGE